MITFDVNFSDDELKRAVWELENREEIQTLQSHYWWYLDSRQWEKWKDCFTEDVELYMQGEFASKGRDVWTENNSAFMSNKSTAHHGFDGVVKFTSPTTAIGRWRLNDNLFYKDSDAKMGEGLGYYLNDYVKCEDGKWRISIVRLGYFHFTRCSEEGCEPCSKDNVDYDILHNTL